MFDLESLSFAQNAIYVKVFSSFDKKTLNYCQFYSGYLILKYIRISKLFRLEICLLETLCCMPISFSIGLDKTISITYARHITRYQSDSQRRQPMTETHNAAITTLTPRARRYMARDRADSPPSPVDVGTLEPKREPTTPVAAQPLPTTGAEITEEKRRKSAANLEPYAGQGAFVESFIAQFETHAKYFQWNEQDRVFQLKNSLTGTAAQALWTGGENATPAELIQLLQSRHGRKRQTERFWAELRARRRRKDEPLQELCQDIRRLMYLASPHETGPLAEHISIDLYVAALGDPNMRMFVMSKDPVMLEDAYNYSLRYEALLLGATKQTQPAILDPASYIYDDKGRKKESVRAAKTPNPRLSNLTGGKPDMPAAEASRQTPDLIRTPTEADQAADEAPITNIATYRETRTTTRTRLPATTVVVGDTS